MNNSTLEKFVTDIKTALLLISKKAGARFHYKGGSFAQMKYVKPGTMQSAQIGEYRKNVFQKGTANANAWVEKAMRSKDWPESVKYVNGVLFVEVAIPEPVVDFDTEPAIYRHISDEEE